MNFHSVGFLAFLAIVVLLFWALANRRELRLTMLFAASLVFYGSYEAWYLSLILFSTLLDYWCGAQIHRAAQADDSRRKRRYLLISLVGNLGVLGFFKYTDWIVESVQLLCTTLGLEVDLWAARTSLLPAGLLDSNFGRIIVPVGISFYTFQTLSYTIDIYRGVLAPAKNLRDFGLFVAFFPQLVAGPIVRAIDFLPQLELRPRFDRQRLREGLWRMVTGLLKKVAIADILGAYLVDPVYNSPGDYSWVVHLLAVYGFAFQIYYDFSGYSDIAIGAAKLLGFDLPENFDLPYRSRSVREFWRRWHISLSTWVRDYIYFPLGGSRGSEWRVARNLLITMLVIGVWHGASILWVIYGLMQGLSMIGERFFERLRGGRPWATTRAKSAVSWFLTFNFTALTCMFVRALDADQILGVATEFGDGALGAIGEWGWWALIGGALLHWYPPAITEAVRRAFHRAPTPVVGIITGLAAGCVAVLVVGETPYIYFQF
ncbi:MBOAT family O-acyltransferase [Engelhardtia mirabilis]|uniref:Peptidoglycan O-acetyltransferase n=1 Tax=Engelhardtia mirabilis TaxID=2528011 RepID=A0A518BHI9_9BACT|nr:Peptidoglycan O-acetyltransferase [Planctomycetes bacterium Pla133]QDV00751.1 Peptidoglycan O-acetyltransferase [Planctomycetes bacterium Pla86]